MVAWTDGPELDAPGRKIAGGDAVNCGDCDMQGTIGAGSELHCDSCPASGEGEGTYTEGPLAVIGPVRPSGDCAIVTKSHFRLVGEAYHKINAYHDDGDVYADARANAQLWASAPEMLAALELGNDRESGPAFLRRVANVVLSIGGPVTAAELQRKADAEEAAIAKAKGATHATGQ